MPMNPLPIPSRLRQGLAATVLAASAVCGSAQAAVAYQSIADLGAAPDINGWCSDCAGGQRVGQQFTLASDTTIASALFTVTSNFVWPTSVTLSVYSDAGGTLGAQLFSQQYTSFAYDVDTGHATHIVGVNLPDLALQAGTYNLFLVNSANLALPGYATADGSTGSQIAQQNASGEAPAVGSSYYYIGSYNGGLVLNTTPVPEASSLAMMLAGLGGLAAMAARRRTRSA